MLLNKTSKSGQQFFLFVLFFRLFFC